MQERKDSRDSLRFDNVEGSAPSANARVRQNSFSPDKHEIGWDSYLRYFLEYKAYIASLVFVSMVLVVFVFQNKDYSAKAGFKIEAGQDLTSNILSDSLMGVRPSQNSLSDISERAYIKAQSASFYEELAREVLSSTDFGYIRFKLGEERKDWVEFIKKTLFSHEPKANEEYIRNRIAEHLDNTIRVDKGGDNNLFFTIVSKNKELTKEILVLLKTKAASILIKHPLREAASALKILEQTEQNIYEQLDSLGSEILVLQKRHNTLIPEELPERYSNLRFEVEKGVLENLVAQKTLAGKLAKLRSSYVGSSSAALGARDYDLQKETDLAQKELASLKAAGDTLKNKLADLNKDFKDLPVFSSKIEKIQLRKSILLEKLRKLTEQLSLAKISLEKVRSAISDLKLNERVQKTGTIKLMAKSLFLFGAVLTGFFALLYYKQSLMPVLMRKADLDQVGIPVAATFPKNSLDSGSQDMFSSSHPRAAAIKEFYHRHVNGHRWLLFASVGKERGQQREILDLAAFALARGRKVCVYSLNSKSFGKRRFKKLLSRYPETFSFEEQEKSKRGAVLANKKTTRKFLNSRPSDELVFVCAPNFSSSPNALILSQTVDKVFVMAKLFQTSASSIRKLLKRHNSLASALGEKFLFVLGNALPYDDINTYIPSRAIGNNNGDYSSGDENEKIRKIA